MKAILFYLSIALFLFSCSQQTTQGPPEGRMSARVMFAGGYSTVMGGSSWKGNIGGAVNVETDLIKKGNSSLGGGLGISMQGSKYEEPPAYYTDPGITGKVNLLYLNLPILYTYKCTSGFYGEIGLQPGLLLAAKDKYGGKSYDYKNAVKSFELGIPVGGGYRLKNGLGIGLRVIPGVTNMDDTGDMQHNFLGMFLVSYRFWQMKAKSHK